MAGDGIIRTSIIVDNTSVKSMMQSIKELKAVVAELKAQGKGSATMFNGELAGVKELQGVIKQLQSDIKALKADTGKSAATDGMSKGAQEATEKFRTLKQAVNDAVLAMDKAHQSSSGTAKYDGKTMNITQLTEAHSKALANLASMESSLAGNREKALQYEQKTRAAIDAKKLADEQRYQSYLQKNIRHEDKEYNSGDRRATMANLLDNRRQNKAYNAYYGDMAKSINAELNATDKVMDAYKAKQIKIQNDIAESRSRTAVAADQKYYADQEKRIKSTSDAIRTRMEGEVKQQNTKFSNEQSQIKTLTAQYDKLYNGIASSITKNRQLSEAAFNAVKEQANVKSSQLGVLNASPMNAGKLGSMDYAQYSAQFQQSYQTYAQQIQAAKIHAEEMHQIMLRTGTAESKLNFATARTGLQQAVQASNAFNTSIGIGTDRVGQLSAFMVKFNSHARWIMAGAVIGGLVAIPTGALQTLKEVELGMAGIQQVVPRLHESRVALNEESIAIIGIASQFGLGVNDIIESYKLWARAYKDTDVVKTLVNSAATLSKADNFSMTEANKAIEGIMLQFGVRVSTMEEAAKASMKIVDSITNVSHNAMVSAQDLAAANIRSASAAKQAGVSFDFLQGMIGTMARNTGRAGGEIGNAIRSMLVSIHSDKAVAEIEKMGVAMYKVGKDGTKSFRDVEEVITELMLVSDATDKNVEKMMLSISGGERKLAA